MSSLTRKILVGALLGVLVLVAMGIYADGSRLLGSLSGFSWWLLAPVLGLTLLNYALRFLKWQLYLRTLRIDVPTSDSALVFFSGLSMAVTPGKFGELLKALLLRDRCGVPATSTASVVIAERLTDFLALLFLAAGGVLGAHYGTAVLAIAAGGSALFLGVIASRRLSLAIVHILARLPVVGRLAPRLEQMLDAISALVRPVPLAITTLLSILAWSCECVGFHLVLTGLPDAHSTLGSATFIYAFATIFGAVTLLPGGLGATEGSLIGLTHQVFGLAATRAAATAGAMIIRFCTLWFAVLVGLVALGLLRRTGLAVAAEPE